MSHCPLADLSSFSGIEFDIKGTFSAAPADAGTGDGGVPSASLVFGVGDALDDVATQYTASYMSAPTNTANFSFGECKPASCSTTCNQYDGSCGDPSKSFNLTSVSQTVRLSWTDLIGGKPHDQPDPTQITGLRWTIPWGGSGSTPYSVDITVDNIQLVAGGAVN